MHRTDDSAGSPAVMPRRISLVEQTAALLRSELARGVWGRRLPSERVLSRSLCISRPTLRQALQLLNEEGRIRSVRGVGHLPVPMEPEKQGQELRANLTIRLLQPGPGGPPDQGWVDEVRSLLFQSNSRLRLHTGNLLQGADPSRTLAQMIDSHPADGWILFRGSPSLLEWFARRGVRCLNVGPVGKPNPIPSIEIDHEAACADAVRRLADLGHVRIGLLTGPAANGLPNFAERFEAAVQSVPDLSGRILHSDGGRRDLCDRIDPLLAQDPSLSALLCADALTYATAATFLAGRGLSIPSRISLIALRHERFLDALVPLPTAYLIDQVRLGRLVHDSVVDLVDGMARPTHRHRIEPVCRPGESIGRPSKQTVA